MDSLDLKFNVGQIATIAKEIGSENPADVVRLYCQDLVNIGKVGRGLLHKLGVEQKKDRKCKMADGKETKAHKQLHVSPDEGGDALTADDLYEKLPEHTLWKEEVVLKKQLFRWMRARTYTDEEDPFLLEKAELDKGVSKSAQRLLGKYNAPLQEWIERRISGDIEAGIDDQGRTVLFPLISLDQPDEDPVHHGGEDDLMDDRNSNKKQKIEEEFLPRVGISVERKGGSEKDLDVLLAALPRDELSPGEQALLAKLMECNGMVITKAANIAPEEKQMLLMDAYGKRTGRLPFKKWIEARLTDYLEVVTQPGPNGIAVLQVLDGMPQRKRRRR